MAAAAAAERRDWAELPRDILTLIFRKLGAVDVIHRCQGVCRPWRQLSLDPDLWRIIDMHGDEDLYSEDDMEELTRIAVDRSCGLVEELYLYLFGTDHLFKYIADRSTRLRRLVLTSVCNVGNEGLAEFVSHCPLLEELQMTRCEIYDVAYLKVGQARPELKSFRLNSIFEKNSYSDDDEDYMDYAAIEIADSMPQLRELQLIGNQLTNKGLHAILDKCLQLESLDIRVCLNVKLDADLRAKLAKIKNVKLPDDSTAGYEFQTRQEEDTSSEEEDMSSEEEDMSSEEYLSGDDDPYLAYDDFFDYVEASRRPPARSTEATSGGFWGRSCWSSHLRSRWHRIRRRGWPSKGGAQEAGASLDNAVATMVIY